MKKHTIHTILLSFLFLCLGIQNIQAQIPKRPYPQKLVNDLAGIFSTLQKSNLENLLVSFSDSTSNQIVILTVNDLEGYDKAQYAYEVGQTWGVGNKEFNNGIVILIKSKTLAQKGEVYIAVGYGLEGALPDAICKRIVEEEMIPWFKQGNYYQGVLSALEIIIPIAKGEYSYQEYENRNQGSQLIFLFVFLAVLSIIILIVRKKGNDNDHYDGKGRKQIDTMAAILLGGLAGRGGHSNSRGGSFGGGGGGFGGFGGGSFGGGGAGGSW